MIFWVVFHYQIVEMSLHSKHLVTKSVTTHVAMLTHPSSYSFTTYLLSTYYMMIEYLLYSTLYTEENMKDKILDIHYDSFRS